MPWALVFFLSLCSALTSSEDRRPSGVSVMCRNDRCSEQLFQTSVKQASDNPDPRVLPLRAGDLVKIFSFGPDTYWTGKTANGSGLVWPHNVEDRPLAEFLEANYKNEMCILTEASSDANATVELFDSIKLQPLRNVTVADYLEDEAAVRSILISEDIRKKHAELKHGRSTAEDGLGHGREQGAHVDQKPELPAESDHGLTSQKRRRDERHLPDGDFASTIKRNGTERHRPFSDAVARSAGPPLATGRSKEGDGKQHNAVEKADVMSNIAPPKQNAESIDPKLTLDRPLNMEKTEDMPATVSPTDSVLPPKILAEENASKPEEVSTKGEAPNGSMDIMTVAISPTDSEFPPKVLVGENVSKPQEISMKSEIPNEESPLGENADSGPPVLNDSNTEMQATLSDEFRYTLGDIEARRQSLDDNEPGSILSSLGGIGFAKAGAFAVPSANEKTEQPLSEFTQESAPVTLSTPAMNSEGGLNPRTLSKRGRSEKLAHYFAIGPRTCPRERPIAEPFSKSVRTEDMEDDGRSLGDNRSKGAHVPDHQVDRLPEDIRHEHGHVHSATHIPAHAENADAQTCHLDPDACPSAPKTPDSSIRHKVHSGRSGSLSARIGRRLMEHFMSACSLLAAQVGAAVPSTWKQGSSGYELVLVTLTILSLLVYVADCALVKECKRRAFANSVSAVEQHVKRLVSACERASDESLAVRNSSDELTRKEEEAKRLAERVRKLESEVSSYKEANDFLKEDVAKMVKESAELKAKVGDTRDIRKTNAALEETLRTKVEQIDRLEEERARELGIMEDLRRSAEEERKHKARLSEEVERLKGKVAKLDSTSSALLKEKMDLEEQIRAMELESNGLREMVAKVAPSRSCDGPAEGGDWASEDFAVLSSTELWEQIVDCSKLHGLIGQLKKETSELKSTLTKEMEGRKALEGEMEHLRVERDEMKTAVQQAEMQTMEAATRLKILEEFFEARQREMQKQLGMQMSISQQQTQQLESREDQMKGYKEEKEHVEQMLTEVRAEVKDLVKENKRQRLSLERAAQEAWLSSKRHERELEALKLENSSLRAQLISYNGAVPNSGSAADQSVVNNLSVPPLFAAMPPQPCLTLPPLPPLPLIPDELCSPELEGSLEGAEFNSFNNHQWNEWDRSDECGRRSRNLHVNGRYSNSSSPAFMGDSLPKGRSARHKRAGNGEAGLLSAKGENRYRLSAERRDLHGEGGSSDPSCETDTSATSPPFLAASGVPVPMARHLPYRPKTIRK